MKTIAIAAALLALSAGGTLAQGVPGGRMDGNSDGKVTLAEFKAARVGMMMRADANRDGKLAKAEFETGMTTMRQAGAAPKGPGPGVMFGMVDGDKDGFLSRPEVEKMLERRFRRIDVDRDGALSTSEMAAMRGGAMGGRGGGAS